MPLFSMNTDMEYEYDNGHYSEKKGGFVKCKKTLDDDYCMLCVNHISM